MSPELTYDVPRSLLEPLSPLMEFKQVGGASCTVGVVVWAELLVKWVWSCGQSYL